jgi:hypothetical protein
VTRGRRSKPRARFSAGQAWPTARDLKRKREPRRSGAKSREEPSSEKTTLPQVVTGERVVVHSNVEKSQGMALENKENKNGWERHRNRPCPLVAAEADPAFASINVCGFGKGWIPADARRTRGMSRPARHDTAKLDRTVRDSTLEPTRTMPLNRHATEPICRLAPPTRAASPGPQWHRSRLKVASVTRGLRAPRKLLRN